MAIISGQRAKTKEKIKAEIDSDTLKQIERYCSWAGINDLGIFIEEASHFIFSKDKEWKKMVKIAKKEEKTIA
ncbi:MAG: hypothetical protein BGO90_14670 [Legionella sp. 40-6]|nr:hypothetical protein [Legionella sp.]OJY25794.1 MAG: hypothetical protein BGO90_14670 [Legionella sp. 40-6]